MRKHLDGKTLGAIAVALLFWSSAFAGIRAALQGVVDGVGYGPGELALLRFGTASVVLALYAVSTRMRLPAKSDLPAIAAAGLLGITVYHVALNHGELTVTAGAASLLIASVPAVTALGATVFLGERLSGWGWAGIFVSFVGVAVIAFGEGEGFALDTGALLVVLAAVSASAYLILQKPYLEKYSALDFTAYTIWAGTLFMLPYLPTLVRQIPEAAWPATLSGVYLGVFPGVLSYVGWTYAMSRAPASIVTPFLNVSPVLAIAIAWVWLGEMPTALSLVGGTLAVAGVVVVTSKGGHAREA